MTDGTTRKTAKRSSAASDAVFDGILEAISRQRLAPGTKLPEESLSQVFHVSRAQVRGALSRLKLRGMVTLEPNRSAQVAAPSVEEVRGMFDLRRWIEPEIAAEVARKITDAQIAKLRAHLDREQAARDADDRIEATRLAGLYHGVIASFSENEVARHYVDELVDRSFLAIYLYQRVGEVMCVNDDHRGLFEALEKRAPEAARCQMAEHLDHIVSRLDLATESESLPDLQQAFRGIAPTA